MADAPEELPTNLTPQCGPHCGTKDKTPGHCEGCHNRKTHGNAKYVPDTERGWFVQ